MGKYIGEPYDPAIRETEHGSKLYQFWRKVRRNPHCEEGEYFPNFYAWAMQSGYEVGAWLRRIDADKPYEDSNCFWYTPGIDDKKIPVSWIDDWNKTVNRIRKHYGMPPLEGTKYGD